MTLTILPLIIMDSVFQVFFGLIEFFTLFFFFAQCNVFILKVRFLC